MNARPPIEPDLQATELELGILRVRLLVRTAITVMQSQRTTGLEATALRHIECELERELDGIRYRRVH